MTTNDDLRHDRFRDKLAEQSLGILDGRARAELLEHVGTCPSCAAELEALAAAADALVLVPAGAEPPVGFESSVMGRIRATAPTRPFSRAVLAFAAVAAVLVAFGGGWVLRTTASPGPQVAVHAGHVAERPLGRLGNAVGTAYVYTGSPSWMFVAVNLPGHPSAVGCTVVATDGTRHDVGTFTLAAGKGAWGTSLPVSFGALHQIVLTAPSGAVVARLLPSAWAYKGSANSWRGPISMRY